jgi:hypothetical protein
MIIHQASRDVRILLRWFTSRIRISSKYMVNNFLCLAGIFSDDCLSSIKGRSNSLTLVYVKNSNFFQVYGK